jgi:hypothetical protein
MNFEITHWGIPGNGADLDDPYPAEPPLRVNNPFFSELLFINGE